MINQIEHILLGLRDALSLTDTKIIGTIINRSLMDISKLLGAEKVSLYLPDVEDESCLICSCQFVDKGHHCVLPNSIPIDKISCVLKKLYAEKMICFSPNDPFSGDLLEYETALIEASGPFSLFIKSKPSTGIPALLIFGLTSIFPNMKNDEVSRLLHTLAQGFFNLAAHNRVLFDRDKLVRFEKLISEISSTFINIAAQKIDENISHALKELAFFFGVDQASVFQFVEGMDDAVLTHLWASSGELQEVPENYVISANKWPWLMSEYLEKGRIFYYESLESLPEAASIDKKSWHQYGLKSCLNIPLMAEDRFLGVLNLAALEQAISWPRNVLNRASVIGKILTAVLDRKRFEEKLHNSHEEIRILKNRLENENTYFKDEIKLLHNFEEIIGNSDELKYILFKIEQVAETDTTVLILGETGTGKELVARAIHEKSLRKNRPLVKIDCGSLPPSIIERELFGHERGAFTGADRKNMGRIEVADGGTLFFDEIGELPLELQPKILRVIQDSEFERLGNPSTRKVDIRIIAATNRDLEALARSNKFRKDLWYRLNIFPVTVPPLRQRKNDIPLLVNFFVNKFSRKMGKKIDRIPADVMEYLKMQDWAGNIRELQNIIERAVIVSRGDTLSLMEKIEGGLRQEMNNDTAGKTLSEVERNHLCRILEETNWRIYGPAGAARILDLNPSTLRFRMKKLGIKKPEKQKRS